MAVHTSPPRERPLTGPPRGRQAQERGRGALIWSLTAVVVVGVILALVGMILNAWLLLGLAAAAAALAALALLPAGVMSHVITTESATDRGPR
ncbi:hypothetical protein UG55_100585 [Frankia sp. EI5c]|uniref:hypothetical protein n=1 Tax=Frankia sp. EI5c TaxID=683316 RepID=UPI0007C36F09|nr:hypothetical protein [Frankia sp. EI5c]OAA28573.1 hypothetical protein UG55_100585 [Frankia sp. EI5c]